jgi:hypothetical protein
MFNLLVPTLYQFKQYLVKEHSRNQYRKAMNDAWCSKRRKRRKCRKVTGVGKVTGVER